MRNRLWFLVPRLVLVWGLLAWGLLAWGPALAGSHQAPGHPRIGLVLSGGGARGAAHVGVLRVLEELRIPISAVAGTSMGALVGGVYATGMDPAEIERRLLRVDWGELLLDEPPREDLPIRRKQRDLQPTMDLSFGLQDGAIKTPGGALAGQQVQNFFSDLVAGAQASPDFDTLPIPFRAVATDLENGRMKVFDSGPLPEVMRASMSVPGFFTPVEIDDRLYVDGGLVRNLPVDVARRMGVDLIIAVNLGSSYLPRDQLNSAVGVVQQMVTILMQQNVERSLKELRLGRDVLIAPDLDGVGATEFAKAPQAIQAGIAAARAAAPALAGLSLSPEEYAAWRASHGRRAAIPAPIASVEVEGLRHVNPALFGPLAAHQLGRPLDRRRLQADIRAIYGWGDFSNLNYSLVPAGGRTRLLIHGQEKPWGPNYLAFGLGVTSDFQGDERFGVRAIYRRAWMNRLGAEWLSVAQLGNVNGFYTEFFQPFTVQRTAFASPNLRINETPMSLFRNGSRIARFDLIRRTLGLDLGLTFLGGDAELRVGATFGAAVLARDSGFPGFGQTSYKENGLRASLRYDRLDNLYFPRQGNRLVLEAQAPQRSMGADLNYQRLSARWTGAYSVGDHTLAGKTELGTVFGQSMPYYDQFTLGGFQRLSGYANEEFRGNQLALGALIYYRRLPSLTPSWARAVYVGGSLEVGALYQTDRAYTEPGTRYGSSLFLGVDTLLGPAYLGLGASARGDTTVYIQVGWP